MKIGLFQINGGTEENPTYEIGSPIFDEVEIELSPDYFSGKTFRVKAKNNAKKNWKIQNTQFNSAPLETFAIPHNEPVKGGELLLEMIDPPK